MNPSLEEPDAPAAAAMVVQPKVAAGLAWECAAFALAACCAAACGGSTAPANPTSATQQVTLSSSAAVVALPAVGDYTETLTLAAATPVGATLTATVSTQAPAGPPALSSFAPHPPNGLLAPASNALATIAPLAFLQLTNATAAAEVFGAYPGFSITTAGTAGFPSGTYKAEVFDAAAPSAGWTPIGAAVLVAPTLTFTGPQGTFTVAAGDTVTLALVAIQVIPSGTVTLSPATSAGQPYALAPGGNVALTAVEAGYSGAFTATSNSPGVATVAPGSAAGQFTVAGVSAGSAQITVTDGASHSAVFSVSVAATSGSFTVHLPEQQGVAVAIPAMAGSNVASGSVTFATAPAGHPYPAGTMVTVTISDAVPAGFGFATPAYQAFGVTFTSNNTLTTAMMPALPGLLVTLAQVATGTGYLDGEVLLPLARFASSCSISGNGAGAWVIAGQGSAQGLTAGTPGGYDFFFGNAICLP